MAGILPYVRSGLSRRGLRPESDGIDSNDNEITMGYDEDRRKW